ncbi:MAG: hypothetical protein K2X43_18420 [Hyphomonadaceae bacterium]|jgi:hypothetical protein|nr:hypothetical protein [Hyphomonadaceae bacterium]
MIDLNASLRLAELCHRLQRALSPSTSAAEVPDCVVQLPCPAEDSQPGVADLRALQGSHPGPGELLPRRLERLGLDPQYLMLFHMPAYRDLRKVCASCKSWRTCARDLAGDDAQSGMESYCLNAPSIDELVLERSGRPGH